MGSASFRSGVAGRKCEGKDIKVVHQDGHELVLDVCGLHEDWKWSALNGWQYVGPSANQPDQAKVDTDGDGIVDASDACPTVKGVASQDPKQHGCPAPAVPPADTDADGIIDAVDACPTVKGEPNADPKKHGCPPPPPPPPPDQDGDGIADASDACPTLVGVASSDPAKNGCPPDGDADGIYDSADACPTEPGHASENPARNGCPKAVVTAKEIVINETIEFEVDKAALLAESYGVIDVVASLMRANPDILKIEVQGHTDDTGKPSENRKLSQSRAEAVVKALTERGVESKRLVAKGYGQTKPLVKEKTPEARQKNRRVQFLILKRDLEAAKKNAEAEAESSKAPPPAAVAPAAVAPAAVAPAAV
ncbi:MAG: OmpA family protein, partial [Deltaproteobacteria bacterium]|nr:OmpA family protein [Deltaproteobacteria bacterium]